MKLTAKIYVAGHLGLVGSAIHRALTAAGYTNIVTRTREQLDLTNQAATDDFFVAERPEYVFLAAAKVGGIHANSTYPADFIQRNLAIALNVIDASHRYGVTKLLNLGSSCIYPREAEQPIIEDALLTGPLEPTNEPYAIAKIAAIKLCSSYNRQHGTNFISLMPTNLFGIGDNYDLQTSHVLPALIARFHAAKLAGAESITLWGDGSALREFLWADDLASACVFVMRTLDTADTGEWLNVGSGHEVAIGRLAHMVREVVYGYGTGTIDAVAGASTEAGITSAVPMCRIEWDTTKPNGAPRKLLDSTRIHELGWSASTPLRDGIAAAYTDYLSRYVRD